MDDKNTIQFRLKSEKIFIMPTIISSKFIPKKFSEVINTVVNKFSSFEDVKQNIPIEMMDEELKIAYLSLIIKMTLDDDGIIDSKEMSEIFLLMTRLKLKSESRMNIRSLMVNPEEIASEDTLLTSIESLAPVAQLRNIHISLYKDLVNVYSSSKESFSNNFSYLQKILPLLNVTEDDMKIVEEAIQNDRSILDNDTDDSMIIANMKKLTMNAAAVGTPIAAIYVSGSVMGLGAAGITSGLATLGMGGLLGMSGMVTGIGVAVLIGVGAYQGVKKFTGSDEIGKSEKRRLMLNQIIKQNQETVSLLMTDINELATRLNKAYQENHNNEININKLLAMLGSFTKAGQVLNNRGDNIQSKVYQTKCPKTLSISKLKSLTNTATTRDYREFIINHYEEEVVNEPVKSKDGTVSSKEFKQWVIKKDLSATETEQLMNSFEIIGYFKASEIVSSKVKGIFK